MKNKWVVIIAILGLSVIEIVALLKGVNGTLMMIIIAAIAGLAGWVMPTPNILLKGGGTNE